MPDQKWWEDIGPAEVWYGDAGSEIKIGDTYGGARWSTSVETAPSYRDKTGDEVWDEIITAQPTAAETDLTGLSLQQLAAVIPGAVLSEGTTSKSLTLKSAVGRSLRANAKSLILKPIVDGELETDETLWLKFPKAYPKPKFEVVADAKTQRVYKVAWAVFRDETTGGTAVLGKDVA